MHPNQVTLIAKDLGVTEQEVVDMNRRLGGDTSLNAPVHREGSEPGEWQDYLADQSPEVLIAVRDETDHQHKALIHAIGVLSQRERRIFEARLLADDPTTLEELAVEFGVSPRSACSKLRRVPSRRYGVLGALLPMSVFIRVAAHVLFERHSWVAATAGSRRAYRSPRRQRRRLRGEPFVGSAPGACSARDPASAPSSGNTEK
jgi:RNA polymerase sigma-32 factor